MLTFPSFRSHFYSTLFILLYLQPLHTFSFFPLSLGPKACAVWALDPLKISTSQSNTIHLLLRTLVEFLSSAVLNSCLVVPNSPQLSIVHPNSSQLNPNDLIWSHLILSHQLKSTYVILRHLLNSNEVFSNTVISSQVHLSQVLSTLRNCSPKNKNSDHLLTLLLFQTYLTFFFWTQEKIIFWKLSVGSSVVWTPTFFKISSFWSFQKKQHGSVNYFLFWMNYCITCFSSKPNPSQAF